MPKCSIVPPAATIAAGITSRRSTIAEAPCTSTMSAPARRPPRCAARARPLGASQRSSPTSVQPSAVSRASVTSRVLSRMLSLRPGNRVWTSATRRGRNAATRSSFSPSRRIRRRIGGGGNRGLRHRERDDLHRRHHLARLDDRVGRQGSERHRLVDQIEPVEPVAVDDEEALCRGEQIGAAGKGGGGRDVGAGGGGGDAVRRLVLAQHRRARGAPRRHGRGRRRRSRRRRQPTAPGLSSAPPRRA